QGEDSRSSSMSEPITVSSSAVVDFYPYRQPDGTIVLHLVNVSHPNAWRGPIDRLTPIGPVTVTIPERYFEGRRPQQATLRRAGEDVPLQSVPGAMQITIPAIRDVEAIRLI
ncbi:MAG TPA: hypothetical protein VGW38_24390, partial [Chloroflexota bacterium]|nr:hypothetical protein [Chloroflexota bacterium]